MTVYELTHVFFRDADGLVFAPKDLGLYDSYDSIAQAVPYYRTQPGFCENKDAFSVRERAVDGDVADGIVFEAVIYLHTEDYEFETEIELGLFADEATAQRKLNTYCTDNARLKNVKGLVFEEIINKCIIGQKQWPEGFSVAD